MVCQDRVKEHVHADATETQVSKEDLIIVITITFLSIWLLALAYVVSCKYVVP